MCRCCPVPNSLKIVGDELSVDLYLDPNLVWFKGHFPTQPLLPGVTQLEWVAQFSRHLVGEKQTKGVPQLKFTLPLLPSETVTLKLKAQHNENGSVQIRFTYEVVRAGQTLTASQGKLLLC